MTLKTTSVLTVLTVALISCGDSENASDEAGLAGYTTNQEEVLEGFDNMREDAQGHYDALLSIEESWAEDEKEILKDYGRGLYELIEKAAKDDDAKGALEDYRNRQFEYNVAAGDKRNSWNKSNWGLEMASSDQSNMLEKDEKKKFNYAIEKSNKAISKIRQAHNKKVEALRSE